MEDIESQKSSDDTILYRSPIAEPIATDKLAAKLLTLVKKLSKIKLVKRGVKEVNKAFRKNQVGLCVIAGDVSPVDIISHIPIVCEKIKVPYVYVKSREGLGTASLTKRPTSVVMLLKPDSTNKYFESYEKLFKIVEAYNPYLKA